ncbi:DoxX family protein [Microbacterium sp. ZW CA_36]|uniref:DoxX family protein n=1 Tax=Microbacterium sp. ZW CA_36 TaxID=3378078 RepID=UPI003852F928
MIVITWIITGLVAAVNLAAGAGKIFTPWEKLSAQMPYTETVGKGPTLLAGWAEVIGAIGLVVPNILAHTVPGWEWAKWVSFAAAIGLALVQSLAIGVHLRRNEKITANIILLLAAVVAAVLIALT